MAYDRVFAPLRSTSSKYTEVFVNSLEAPELDGVTG